MLQKHSGLSVDLLYLIPDSSKRPDPFGRVLLSLLLLEEYLCGVEEFVVHIEQYLTSTARARQEGLRIPVHLGLGFPATCPLRRKPHPENR
jgi:hypothetical protein